LGGAFLAWEDRTPAELAVRVEHIEAAALSQPLANQPAAEPTPVLTPAFAVYPIFPNPTSMECRIEFDLPARMPVDIEVFDVSGRRVARPAEGRVMEPGPASISWRLQDGTGRHVPSGLYLVRLRAGINHAVLRMAVTR
jgi:hypothetical protein